MSIGPESGVEEAFASMTLKQGPAFGLSMHPTRPLLAAGLISGQLKLYEYTTPPPADEDVGDGDDSADGSSGPAAASEGSIVQTWSARPHKGACRAVRFAEDGETIFSTGVDGTLQQRSVETNQPTWRRRNAAEGPVNSLTLLSGIGIATGDDDGRVRCWDLRQHKVALSFHEHGDYISDMLYTEPKKGGHVLAVGSGDGHLAVFDLRKGRLWARSDPQEDEILCLSLLKRGKKLLCGTQVGTVGIFSWGDFGDVSDRLLGHPASVDCMVAHGEDMVVTGSGDGLIRLVSVHPNKVLGVLGEHGDAGIEQLALSASGEVLASCGHDSTIKLYDVAYINDADDGADDADGSDDDSDSDAGEAASSSARANKKAEDSDSDEDDAGSRATSKRRASSDAGSLASERDPRKKRQLGQINKANAAIKLGANFFSGLGED